MEKALKHYEFINSETGNIIAYLSLPSGMDEKEETAELEKKRAELAVTNKLYFELIFWREGNGQQAQAGEN